MTSRIGDIIIARAAEQIRELRIALERISSNTKPIRKNRNKNPKKYIR